MSELSQAIVNYVKFYVVASLLEVVSSDEEKIKRSKESALQRENELHSIFDKLKL
jgi:hypothetical protein